MPCSKGEKSELTGEFCPYQQNEPLTIEGFEAWEIIQRGFVRYFPNGKVAGFCIPTILNICTALGYDQRVLLHLLDYGELGLFEAIKKHGNSNSEHINTDSSD
ncbi:MAG: hypothetical protein ABL857_00170 [Rickettsiales bacterium]